VGVSRNRPVAASIHQTMVRTVPSDLLQAAKGGDGWAFETLLDPVIDPAFRLAWGMLHDRQAAEDAVQEASLLAWRKLASLRRQEGMRSWFFAIVANQCRRTRRARWWSVLKVPEVLPAEIASANGSEPAADLRKAIRGLGHRKRLVLILYYYLDLPLVEIAAVVGGSEAAVKATLYRTIRELRPALTAKEA
jgi:RNA polymerase sigma-70 factor (ECF subfamily)